MSLSNISDIDISEISKLKVSEVSSILKELNYDEYEIFIDIFSNDSRTGIQKLCLKAQKELLGINKEKERLRKLNEFENKEYSKGVKIIAGVDEVGRGPLAGPVVAAVVILPENCEIIGINDSKKLSEKKRNEIFEEIVEKSIAYSIGVADNNEIDEYNILNATYLAMKRALENLDIKPEVLLNDAVRIPDVNIKQIPIIKGDSKSISIAAASIIAKVTRDKMMVEYHEIYPYYGFDSNKGYGTNIHYDGIRSHGITKIHRKTFLKNFDY